MANNFPALPALCTAVLCTGHAYVSDFTAQCTGHAYESEFTGLCTGHALTLLALRKAKIVYNFGLSECNRVNMGPIKPIMFIPIIHQIPY